MTESIRGSRNQKLVIDYLESLLSNEDDQVMEVAAEIAHSAEELEETIIDISSLEITEGVDLEEEARNLLAEVEQGENVAEIETTDSLETESVEEATVEEATVEEATVEEATVEEATVEEATVEEASVEEEAVEEATAAETAEEVFVVEEKEASAESEIEQAASVSVATEGSVQQVKEESEQRINCVIVLMYGLKLAIPFENIEGMIKLSNVSLSLDNDRNWILGDFTSATMRTHVVDTAQILFGENYDPLKSNYNEMLVLAGKHWSIVFDKIIKAQSILISDVTENPSPQFRPWLTGTYMAEKCALVNVPAMVKMFEEELNG